MLSSRTKEVRIADVERVVKAARSVVAKRDSALIAAIAESTGLTTKGVDLALTKHLEIDPTEDELALFVERAGDAPKVIVLLSANVFVGALRAIAFARAASNEVVVRPSRRDPAFARALVQMVNEAAIVLDEDFDVAKLEAGEVHVYGRDETIADIRARTAAAQKNVRVRGHGAGMGVAWISRAADLDASARSLADDVVVFDQRGCLSPRLVLVEDDDVERANAFGEALHSELERLDLVVPRGPLPADERIASDRYIATMTYACRALVGTDHAIGIAPPGAPMVPSPAYRHVHIAQCATQDEARVLLAPIARSVVAVGSDDRDGARAIAPTWARISSLGQMQKPRLDGPVDRRDDA